MEHTDGSCRVFLDRIGDSDHAEEFLSFFKEERRLSFIGKRFCLFFETAKAYIGGNIIKGSAVNGNAFIAGKKPAS